jgi:hypothetical protein
MTLLMFYSLTCLSFFRYCSYGFRSLSIYFSIDYYRFRNYRNIGVVFVSDNIVSISFSRKKNMKIKVIWSLIDRFRPFSSLFVYTTSEHTKFVPTRIWNVKLCIIIIIINTQQRIRDDESNRWRHHYST